MTKHRRRVEGRTPVVRPFDFLRPNKLNREHIRSLTLVQETFTRGFTTQLASVLRSVSQVTPKVIEQKTWDEYLRSAPSPCYGILLSLAPLPGAALLTLPLDVSYTIVELLLGGGALSGRKIPDRALSEIESVLLHSFIDRVLPELKAAFEPLCSLDPKIIGVEANLQFAQIAGPTDLTIVTEYEITLDNVTSQATLCIPFNMLQETLEEVTAQGKLTNVQVDLVRARERVARRAEEVQVSVSARFQHKTMRSSEIMKLQPGDLIKLDCNVEEPLILWAGGRPAYRVKLGKKGKKTAVEVLAPMMLDASSLSGTNERRGGIRR